MENDFALMTKLLASFFFLCLWTGGVYADELKLTPVTLNYHCTDEILKSIKLTEYDLTFMKSGKVLRYRNEKFRTWTNGDKESARSTPFDRPYCLPGGKTLALIHIQSFYEWAKISASFYDVSGNKIGGIASLDQNVRPQFSPNGQYVVVNASDPYADPMVDGEIILYNLKGEKVFASGNFPTFFAKTFSIDMSSAGPMLVNLFGEKVGWFIFSEDSQYFAFPIFVSHNLSQSFHYEKASMVYILVISTEGKLVEAIEKPAMSKQALLYTIRSVLERQKK